MTDRKAFQDLVPLEDIIFLLPGSTYCKDTKLVYRGCNEAARKIVGLKSCNDIIGMTDYDIAELLGLPISVVEKFRRDDEYVINTRKPLLNQIEPKFKIASGEYIIQLSNRVPIIKNGKVVGVLGNSIDITSYANNVSELKTNKNNLQYLQQKYMNMLENFSNKFMGAIENKYSIEEYIMNIQLYLETIFSHLPCHVYWIDTKGIIRGSNNQMAISFGYSRAFDIIGMTLDQLLEKIHGDKTHARIIHEKEREIVETKKGLTMEEVGELADGKTHYFLTHKSPLLDVRGKVIGILGVSMDITERKQMEKELQQAKEKAEEFNKLKSQFISNMEHDIRTPFTGLESMIELLSSKETDAFKQQALAHAQSAVEEFKIIVDNILNFDDQRYGHALLEKPFQLSTVFNSIYRLYRPTADSKHLTLSHHIDSNIPRVLICDEWRIKHILINLVGNALKFTEQGRVSFDAKLIRCEDRAVLIELTVNDTGIGIPQDKVNVIFERYVRLNPSNKGRYKGTGLGLAAVKKYVEELKGECRPIQSEEGKGTTIRILIPMKVSLDQDVPTLEVDTDEKALDVSHQDNEPSSKSKITDSDNTPSQTAEFKPPTESTQSASTKTRVLFVEDSLTAQFTGKTILTALNCDIDVASTAEEALSMIDNTHYDLIFADIGLPQMNGIEMTRRIRDAERKKGDIEVPIIGQSANANTENKKACIDAGMQDLLAKPLSHADVENILTTYTQHEEITHAFVPFTIQHTHVIDVNALKDIWPIDTMKTVFSDNKADILQDISDFKQAYANKDWTRFLFLTHKLRGTFVYVAAIRLEEVFSQLEDYLNHTPTPDFKAITYMYDLVLTELDAVFKTIETL
jgi:PAS domain S-box-containing protein